MTSVLTSLTEAQLRDQANYYIANNDEDNMSKNDDIIRHMIAANGERIVRTMTNGSIRHGPGYDVIGDSNETYEVKSTASAKTGDFSVGGLLTKKGKCDYIAIVDMLNGRVSIIPAKIFFKRAKLVDVHGGSFRWKNTTGPVNFNTINGYNAALFAEYEIRWPTNKIGGINEMGTT
jgi:hypothetical protein|tara:strand:+ start:3700 stop:4227 length:528 start_codon:yes stop_codon:yes gene_type:complete